ncbi:MAG: 3-isopropylmalate dehydrogenase [Candidatus Latescibacterota bacterium]|jgi:3-isopropylmalate dehydrogenase
MTTFKIALLEGDGIGPEIAKEAVKVLHAIQKAGKAQFEITTAPFGGDAYFSHGKAFTDEAKAVCDAADAIIKGPIGLDKEQSEKIPVDERPERGALLPLRRRYDTFANFRPVYLPKSIQHFSPLRPEVVGEGIDIMMIRELVGGLYFGSKERGVKDGKRYVNEMLEYDEDQIRRILHVAFKEAQGRTKKLHNVHKSNVLMSSVLWNEVLEEVAPEYPDVTVEHIIVDAAATALVLKPTQFDVMVMENMFGDILSDLGGGLLGSLGLMPSACIGPEKSYYEPSHGSAPDIAGQGIANPYSMIGSVALMLDKSFGLKSEASAVWDAMQQVFADGFTTADLSRGGEQLISTAEFGDKVVAALKL